MTLQCARDRNTSCQRGRQLTLFASDKDDERPASPPLRFSSPPCQGGVTSTFFDSELELAAQSSTSTRATWGGGRSSRRLSSSVSSGSSHLAAVPSVRDFIAWPFSSPVAAAPRCPSMVSGGPLAAVEIDDTDLLRATHASCPLAGFGAALRGGTPLSPAPPAAVTRRSSEQRSPADEMADWYNFSFPTSSIDDFWSHSWRASATQKIVTLLMYYNSLPAAIIGSVVSFVLRFWQIRWQWARDKSDHLRPISSMYLQVPWWAGQVIFVLVLALWRPSRKVFLDKTCIHQSDPRRKEMGVKGIGVFLRNSRRLVVLWDSTYFRRLWCTFEVAAYLHHHHSRVGRGSLHLRPVGWGPLCLLIMASISIRMTWQWLSKEVLSPVPADIVIVGLSALTAHLIREHMRAMREVEAQLQSFRLSTAECFCCSHNHIHPETGADLSCDRVLVKKCIISWFGSVEDFEAKVEQELLPVIRSQFSGCSFPIRWCLLCSLPGFWGNFGLGFSSDLNGEAAFIGFSAVVTQFIAIQVMAFLAFRVEVLRESGVCYGFFNLKFVSMLTTFVVAWVPWLGFHSATLAAAAARCMFHHQQDSGFANVLECTSSKAWPNATWAQQVVES